MLPLLLITWPVTKQFVSTPGQGANPPSVVLLRSDNSSSEAWACKGAQVSFTSRASGPLQAGLMMPNPVGFHLSHIPTLENDIADTLFHYNSEVSLLTGFPSLCQTLKELNGCLQFHPNAELIYCIIEALLQNLVT